MPRQTLEGIDATWHDVEALVDVTPRADPWCSGPDWVVPVHHAFAEDSEPLVLVGDEGMALLARYRSEEGVPYIAGLEPLWGFACPLLGADPGAVATMTRRELDAAEDWRVLILTGLPESRSVLTAVHDVFADDASVTGHLGISRRLIDLTDGHETWLSRRSQRFRRTLRRADRDASAAGVEFVEIATDADVFERCLAIERSSWKGAIDDGITSPSMERFYRAVVARLARRDRLMATVAIRQGRDIGYILGGVRSDRYRGLQLSYTHDAADLSIGHLLQLHTIRCLDDGDRVHTYDMGMDMEYKQRWADREERSVTFVIDRGGRGRRSRFG